MATSSSPSSELGIEVDLFVDRLSAEQFLCPICHFVVTDGLEHIPTDNQGRCPYIFCRLCAQQWINSKRGGIVPCPSGICSKSGFTMSTMRPLSVRDKNRLQILIVKCQFGCGEEIAHEAYHLHVKKCKDNPVNICRICKVYKSEDHDCALTVNNLGVLIKQLKDEKERVRVMKEIEERKLRDRIKELEKEIEGVRLKEIEEGKLRESMKVSLIKEIERVKVQKVEEGKLRRRMKVLEKEIERGKLKEAEEKKLLERIKELEKEIERGKLKEAEEKKLLERIKELEEENKRVKLVNIELEKQKSAQVNAKTFISQLDFSWYTSPEVSPEPSRKSPRRSSESSSETPSQVLQRNLAKRAYRGGYIKDADSNPLISFKLHDTLDSSDESILKQLETKNNINVGEVWIREKIYGTAADGKQITRVILALTPEQRLKLGSRPVLSIENELIDAWDDFDVPHCSYCLKLDHIQKQCVNMSNNLPRTCRKCLMAHKGICSPGTVIPLRFCQTCKMVSNINAEHRSQSLQCEHFRQRVLKKLPKINFDYSVFPSIQQQLYGHQYNETSMELKPILF